MCSSCLVTLTLVDGMRVEGLEEMSQGFLIKRLLFGDGAWTGRLGKSARCCCRRGVWAQQWDHGGSEAIVVGIWATEPSRGCLMGEIVHKVDGHGVQGLRGKSVVNQIQVDGAFERILEEWDVSPGWL